jgi:ATP-dependent DNA ligase
VPGGPAFIAPMLATAARSLPPHLEQWAVEPKFDGMRALIGVDRGWVRVWSRPGPGPAAMSPQASPSWQPSPVMAGGAPCYSTAS